MNSFDVNGKVALVTGGISGIGLAYAQELLRNGAKGVSLADINEAAGNKVVKELKEKYGENKAIFVITDVTDYQQFEEAFKQTVATFKNVDILINNAGICRETEDMWRKSVEINIIGVINGILLGLEHYLAKYKSGAEGLIVNTGSIAGIQGSPKFPIYSATKFAVHGITLSFGHHAHYERQHVRIVAICPGYTKTPLFNNFSPYEKFKEVAGETDGQEIAWQTVEQITPELLKIIQKAPTGTVWVLENGEPAYQFALPHRAGVSKVYL